MFVENLPGYPDNIRPSSSGGYWVGMSMVFTGFDDLLMFAYPRARNFLAKVRITRLIMLLLAAQSYIRYVSHKLHLPMDCLICPSFPLKSTSPSGSAIYVISLY